MRCACSPQGGSCPPTTPGPRQGCEPAGDWLGPLQGYADFFARLKPPGRVLVSVISGPVSPVEVKLDGGLLALAPSCQGAAGAATPAPRLRAFTAAMAATGNKGYFNHGTDVTNTQDLTISACSPDYGPAVRVCSRRILIHLSPPCAPGPLLTRGCGLACAPGVTLSAGAGFGAPLRCQTDCLADADCVVEQFWAGSEDRAPELVPRCPAALFSDPSRRDCGGSCPCWRLVTRPQWCGPANGPDAHDESPFLVEMLRDGPVPKNSAIQLRCATSVESASSPALRERPLCGG